VGSLQLRPPGVMELSDVFESVFSGKLLIRSGGNSLAKAARQLVKRTFGEHPETLDSKAFRDRLKQARQGLKEPEFLQGTLSLLESLDIPLQGLRLDQLRLRAVTPGLEDIEAAAPVFFAHRDTWYGNPKCQINVWIPLHEVGPRNSFRFFLDYFQTEIANDSKHFDADEFRGFGRLEPATGYCYPRALLDPGGEVYDVCMKSGDVLLFSAAHLHQTLPNRTDNVRFSVDFRFYLEHHLEAHSGAPDPDNESRGLMTEGYTRCDS
jgi:hypothetical protein